MGWAVPHGRYLKTACLWVLRKEEKDEQPMSFSKFVERHFTTESFLGFGLNVCAGRDMHLFGFSARQPQMWTIENSAHVPNGKKDNGFPNTAASFSVWTQLPDNSQII